MKVLAIEITRQQEDSHESAQDTELSNVCIRQYIATLGRLSQKICTCAKKISESVGKIKSFNSLFMLTIKLLSLEKNLENKINETHKISNAEPSKSH